MLDSYCSQHDVDYTILASKTYFLNKETSKLFRVLKFVVSNIQYIFIHLFEIFISLTPETIIDTYRNIEIFLNQNIKIEMLHGFLSPKARTSSLKELILANSHKYTLKDFIEPILPHY